VPPHYGPPTTHRTSAEHNLYLRSSAFICGFQSVLSTPARISKA
jgi:hypothetical protein